MGEPVQPVTQSPEVVGIAEHYAQFVQLCRARIDFLGITYDTLDAICGFSDGYTGKLLCEEKAMSIYSFFTLSRALALLPQFAHDEMQLARLKTRREWIKMRRAGARFRGKSSSGIIRFQNHIDFYRQIGQKGGLAKHARALAKRAHARKAAAARWGNGHGSGPRA